HRLHARDFATDETQVVDVVNEVDENGPAALAVDPPGDIEICRWLLQQPQRAHCRQPSDPAAPNDLARQGDDRVVTAMVAYQQRHTRALRRGRELSRSLHGF